MLEWQYNNEPVHELPDGTYGFAYRINFTDGTYYIGKRKCITETTLPMLKNGERRPNSILKGTRVNLTSKERENRTTAQKKAGVSTKRTFKEIVIKESKWKDYEGSSEFTSDLAISSKVILCFCPSKRNLTYSEIKYQFKLDAIESSKCRNVCINNQFFRDNIK